MEDHSVISSESVNRRRTVYNNMEHTLESRYSCPDLFVTAIPVRITTCSPVRQRHRSAVVPWFSSHPTQDYLSAFESAKRRVTLSVQAEPDRSIPRG